MQSEAIFRLFLSINEFMCTVKLVYLKSLCALVNGMRQQHCQHLKFVRDADSA